MEDLKETFRKYKWFYTKSGKLVVGGKSAAQNDSLLEIIERDKHTFIVMHTEEPGSPFSVILSDIKKISKADLEECAIFTACFSRAWRSGKKKASVDVFDSKKIFKTKGMKTGTWGVKPTIKNIKVQLMLTLTKQSEVLRAVPVRTINKPKLLLFPGKIDKHDLAPKIEIEMNQSFSHEEVLSALPAGGSKITKNK